MAKKNPTLAQVDDYAPRPYDEAKADPEVIAEREARNVPDQIADYHKENPTLDTKGDKAHDPEFQEDLRVQAVEETPVPEQQG